MLKKSNWININPCYKKSIKKYNKCIRTTKCSKKNVRKNAGIKVKKFIKDVAKNIQKIKKVGLILQVLYYN